MKSVEKQEDSRAKQGIVCSSNTGFWGVREEIIAYLSKLNLNVNGFNSLVKRYRLADQIKTRDSSFVAYKKCTTQESQTQANRPPKQAAVAILVSDKAGFKTKLVTRDKDHFILVNGTIHQENTTIVNIYTQMLVHPIS